MLVKRIILPLVLISGLVSGKINNHLTEYEESIEKHEEDKDMQVIKIPKVTIEKNYMQDQIKTQEIIEKEKGQGIIENEEEKVGMIGRFIETQQELIELQKKVIQTQQKTIELQKEIIQILEETTKIQEKTIKMQEETIKLQRDLIE